MDNIKWLFFDIGSTLADESKVYEDIFRKIAEAACVSEEYVNQKAIEYILLYSSILCVSLLFLIC